MNRALFLDLDNVIITTKSGRLYPLHSEDWKLIPEIIPIVKRFVKEKYIIIILTNQTGISSGFITEKVFITKLNKICNSLEYHVGLKFKVNYWYCSKDNTYNTKPNSGMAYEAALEYELALHASTLIGTTEDKEFAFNSGIRNFLTLEEAQIIPNAFRL